MRSSASRRLQSVRMSQRSWVGCDLAGSSTPSSGFETDPESAAESGISACSSLASIDGLLGSSSGGSDDYEDDRRFRVATYNVLTDNCIRPDTYLYCPEDVRFMPGRHGRIVSEVRTMDPDVICFQEVDYEHFETRLKVDMNEMGYQGVLHERLDDQGMAVFWKDATFQLLQQKHCLLHHLAETHLQMNGLSPVLKKAVRKAIERPEAVLLVRLRHRNSGRHLAVANLHVAWTQLKYPALQTLQGVFLTSKYEEICWDRK